MPLERPEETQGQKNVSDKTSPPELLTDTPDFTTESRTFLPSDKDNSPTEHAARTRNSSGEEARDKTCVRPRSRNIRQGEHKKEAPSQEGGREWPLRLTPSLVLMFVVFELVTLSFFFLFGLIIGKGTVPPSPQAELERILPAEENRTEQAQEILPQEELRFMANLKADDSAAERQQNGTTSAPSRNLPKGVRHPFLPTTAISMILSSESRHSRMRIRLMPCEPAWKEPGCAPGFNGKRPRREHGVLFRCYFAVRRLK